MTATAADQAHAANIQQIRRDERLLIRSKAALKDELVYQLSSKTELNWLVICCKMCKSNGFPHEPITFQKVSSTVLSDGSNEVKRWLVRDYITGNIHAHKPRRATQG